MRLAATAAGLIALATVSGLDAQSNRSLTDSDNGRLLAQRGATITVPTDDSPRTPRNRESFLDDGAMPRDREALQERVLLLRSAIKALTESLAISNSEAEMFKRQSADLASKLDAFGIAGLEGDESKIEQRLLAAVRDLRLLKQQNEAAIEQLLRLSESVQVLIKTSQGVDPDVRLSVETELRKTAEMLGSPNVPKTEAVEATLNDGMVMDVKDDLALVVANIGEKQGVKVGMPFQVWREDKRIGNVRVIDVRSRISGAIIQNLESENTPIKVGDRLKVDARQ